jgi:ribosomal protein L37AE/L43A
MKTKWKNIIALLAVSFFAIIEAYSRSGGAGGAHSSGGGGGDGFGAGAIIGWLLSGSGGIGKIIAIVVIIIYLIYKYKMKANSGGTDLESGSSQGPQGAPRPISPDFFTSNPGFSEQEFSQKVKTAFLGIQDAWMNKNLGKVRKWISDGVYQRFSAQFTMMNMLDQTNMLSNINIKQIRIESAIQEGAYSIVTASVYVSMDDNFICKKDPRFNEKFTGDTSTEYWTFIKKSGVAEKDLYNSNNCPNCGYPMNNNAGQVSKCESCGTVTYLGDYDWVLCEITQEEDYLRGNSRISQNAPELKQLYSDTDSDFCIQLMEDKVSNAIMQYFVSKTTHNLKYLNRFTDDALFARIEQQVKGEDAFVFNRLYLNDVSLTSVAQANNMWMATFNVFYSSMRLKETPSGLNKIDDTVMERALTVTLAKKVGAVQKSKLWSFECPSCGAPYTDTTITECGYCSAKINSADNDWVMINLSDAN